MFFLQKIRNGTLLSNFRAMRYIVTPPVELPAACVGEIRFNFYNTSTGLFDAPAVAELFSFVSIAFRASRRSS